MDAEQALALLRARNRYVRQLPSGLWARIALPNVADAIAAGELPLPVVKEVRKLARLSTAKAGSNGHAEEAGDEDEDELEAVTPEMYVALSQYRRTLVKRALKGLAETEDALTEDVEFTSEVISELDPDDAELIFSWADRRVEIDPKAPTPASAT